MQKRKTASVPVLRPHKRSLVATLNHNKYYMLMVLPSLALIIVFGYVPMYGVLIAFQDYNIGQGFLDGPWVGFKHFINFFQSMYFGRTFKNTILLGIYNILWSFPFPIIFALFINELRGKRIKKVIQTTSYFPHFISTVVVVGIMKQMLDPNMGMVNALIQLLGGDPINFFSESGWFRTLYVGSGVWQGFGWGSIIYLSALTSIDPTLYESADIDGANQVQKMLRITLPQLVPTMVIILILGIGQMMSVSFEKVLLMYNPLIYEVSDVIQTYVYRKGIVEMNFSSSAAIGLFSSVINVLFLVTANRISKKFTEISLW